MKREKMLVGLRIVGLILGLGVVAELSSIAIFDRFNWDYINGTVVLLWCNSMLLIMALGYYLYYRYMCKDEEVWVAFSGEDEEEEYEFDDDGHCHCFSPQLDPDGLDSMCICGNQMRHDQEVDEFEEDEDEEDEETPKEVIVDMGLSHELKDVIADMKELVDRYEASREIQHAQSIEISELKYEKEGKKDELLYEIDKDMQVGDALLKDCKRFIYQAEQGHYKLKKDLYSKYDLNGKN